MDDGTIAWLLFTALVALVGYVWEKAQLLNLTEVDHED